MEIIIAVVIIGVGLVWYFNNKAEEKAINDAKKEEVAPYKVEAPVAESAPVEEKKPAKAKKAPAKKPAAAKKTAPKTKKPKA